MGINVTFKNISRKELFALLEVPLYQVEELPIDEHIEIQSPSFEVDSESVPEHEPVIKTRKPRAKKNTTEKVDELTPPVQEQPDLFTPPPPPPAPEVTFNDFMQKVTTGLIAGKYPMELVDAVLAVNGLKTLMDAQSKPELWDNITKSLGV